MQLHSTPDPAAAPSRFTRLLAPRRGSPRRRHGLDQGERALVAMIVAREARQHAVASAYARQAAEMLGDEFAVTLLVDEGLPAPLTGRLGALADATGALVESPPRFGLAERRRLDAQRFDADELADLFVTVALVQANLHRAAIASNA